MSLAARLPILIFLFFIQQQSKAQFLVKEISNLGKLQARHISYYPEKKEWILSSGYNVFKVWNNFLDAAQLFNSYPHYQFTLDRLPNYNFFSRHFDTKSPPYGFEYRSHFLDSSKVYVMGDSLKKINRLTPSVEFKMSSSAKNGDVYCWTANNCFFWGKDSSIICNNGTIGIEKKVNGKDSLHSIFTKYKLTAASLDKAGDVAFVGSQENGWYFIPTDHPDEFTKVTPQEEKEEVKAFYIDENKKQVWVSEGSSWDASIASISLYNYSSGKPVFVKHIKAASFGMRAINNASFSFDFNKDQLYVLDGIRSLLLFDLLTATVIFNFFRPLEQQGIKTVHRSYYNEEDGFLYLTGSKEKSDKSIENFLFRLETDSAALVRVVIPKNRKDSNQLYEDGLQTSINRLPASAYGIKAEVTLSNNGLALLPVEGDEFLLYNMENGNMITTFPSINLDLNAKSRFSPSNTAHLSPDGNAIFEWMVKVGISTEIDDTLQMSLVNINTGKIVRKKMILSEKSWERVTQFYWNHLQQPTFTIQSSLKYPEEKVITMSLDSTLQATNSLPYVYKTKRGLYDKWRLPKSDNYLFKTKTLNEGSTASYTIENSLLSTSVEIYATPLECKEFINQKGVLLMETTPTGKQLHWFGTDGKKIHKGSLPANYRVQQLVSTNLYCTEEKTSMPFRINLLTGELQPLHIKSNTDYSYVVSPDEKFLFTASEKINTWQFNGDSLHQLYSVEKVKNFVKHTQLHQKYLVSDGRIWDLNTGFLKEADIDRKAIVNDSTLLSTIIVNDILDYKSFWDEGKTTHELKKHEQLFVPSISKSKNIDTWKDSFDKILLATSNITDRRLKNVYELPFKDESLNELKMYPIQGQDVALIVKSEYKFMDNDPLTSPEDKLLLLNLSTGKYPEILSGKIVQTKQMPTGGPFLFYLLNQQTKQLQAYKIENNSFKKIKHNVVFASDSMYNINIVDEHHIVYAENNAVVFRNLLYNTKEEVKYRYLSTSLNVGPTFEYDNTSETLYVGYDDGGIVKIKNKQFVDCIKTNTEIKAFVGSNDQYLLSVDALDNYYFINKQTLQTDLRLYTFPDASFAQRKYIWLTKENYYMATPGVEGNIHFVQNNRTIPLKQGDLLYNRPDKVLEYLNGPKSEIDFYKQLHDIRLQKYKTTSYNLAANQIAPQLKANSNISGNSLIIKATAQHTLPLASLQVLVNGCPLLVNIKLAADKKSFNQTIDIPLNAGPNSIYAWAEDEKGYRSNFIEFKATGEFADSGKWYFVGIGVSQYKDSSQNLKYADKDIRDIAKFLAREYPGIFIDTLFNENVTAANIQALKQRLKSTQPDDKVLVSFSGHGLLDEDKKFWFATHDINFNEPAQNGFSMNAITGLLEDIPARYRMITLDACHSGDVVAGFTTPTKTEIIAAVTEEKSTVKGNIVINRKKENNASASLLLKSMQLIFTDQLSNTGINLIAASSGTEYALEGEKWNNGVFTYALINGWNFAARKESSYDQIHYRDLKQYLQKRVTELTGGQQTPNTVMENGELNWWLVPPRF